MDDYEDKKQILGINNISSTCSVLFSAFKMMAPFKKVVILNKELQISSHLSKRTEQTPKSISITNISSSSMPIFLISASKLPYNLPVLPTQRQLTFELKSLPTHNPIISDSSDDVLPRAAMLFMINYYFQLEHKHRSREELLKIADTIQIIMTADDVRFIEEITRDRNNWYWEKLRAGRVTSSQFKSVCQGNIYAPAIDLLMEICYPEKYIRPSQCAHDTELVATLSFISQMKRLHTNFDYKKVGLIVHQNYPYFAANPSGLCSCDCCGQYVVEIKCPSDVPSVENLLQMKDSFMEKKNGAHCLRKDHRYYYELQMHMALCDTKFAWFFIWSKRFRITNRIWFNSKFWEENSEQALDFAKKVLSVELMSSYYTHTY